MISVNRDLHIAKGVRDRADNRVFACTVRDCLSVMLNSCPRLSASKNRVSLLILPFRQCSPRLCSHLWFPAFWRPGLPRGHLLATIPLPAQTSCPIIKMRATGMTRIVNYHVYAVSWKRGSHSSDRRCHVCNVSVR